MHEVSLLLSVAEQVANTIEGTDITHVDQVVLEIGDLTTIVPEFMVDGYSFISDEFDYLRGSKLIIHTIVGKGKCTDCGHEFPIVENKGKCPVCGSFNKEITSGKEFIIKEIRILE